VKRTDDPADRRGVRAEVTPLGRERHAAGAKVVTMVYENSESNFRRLIKTH